MEAEETSSGGMSMSNAPNPNIGSPGWYPPQEYATPPHGKEQLPPPPPQQPQQPQQPQPQRQAGGMGSPEELYETIKRIVAQLLNSPQARHQIDQMVAEVVEDTIATKFQNVELEAVGMLLPWAQEMDTWVKQTVTPALKMVEELANHGSVADHEASYRTQVLVEAARLKVTGAELVQTKKMIADMIASATLENGLTEPEQEEQEEQDGQDDETEEGRENV